MRKLAHRYDRLVQMSYVTRNMDAALAHAEEALGLTGFHRSQSEIEVLSYGEPRQLGVKAAIVNFGARQFEIIEPVSGAIEIYQEALERARGPLAFHHVAIAVPGPHAEWERLLAEVRDSGEDIAYLFPAGPSPDARVCFCYLDTRASLGHFTEFLWADPALKGIPAAPWL